MQIKERELLEMALIGFGMRAAEIDRQISSVRAQLALGETPASVKRIAEHTTPGFRKLSPEGRARIVAATRKRWAAYRRAKARR